ncbi:MAG: type II secretion system protein [Candidatus Moraniibacteriota bacterium]|nr:MAG: type II secretion system protein [Candidatus Moranbacteria bacterium]
MKVLCNERNRVGGFTLIEILLVIGMIAVLATVVLVALDPAKRFRDVRDAKRSTDVQSILSAIQTYIVDNQGAMPAGLTTTEKQLGTAVSGCAIATGGCAVAATGDCVNFSATLAKYLKTIPLDPNGGTAALTKYSVAVDANGIVTVKACSAEGGTNISVSR